MYNTELYLADCLDSLINQTYENLEILVIDDGSKDGSLTVAREYSRKDRRVRIIRQSNRGLGGARNTGVRRSRGAFLTFVDSDDTIPQQAFEQLMSSLRGSGSDIAVGALERLSSGRRFKPLWAQLVHHKAQIGIQLDEYPEVLRNFYTPGKVYRASFWKRKGLIFREGVLFEDQPVVTQAYCLANSIDVLDSVTYTWLERSDGSSLSQSMYTVQNVNARKTAIELTAQSLRNIASPGVYGAWLWTLLEFHFPGYLRQSLRSDAQVYEAILSMIRSVVDEAQVIGVPNVSAQNRVLVYLSLVGSKSHVDRFLLNKGLEIRELPVLRDGGTPRLELPFFKALPIELPREALELSAGQLKLSATLRTVSWVSATRLRLTGWAYIMNLPPTEDNELQVMLVNTETGRLLTADLVRVRSEWASVESRHRWISNDEAGFEAEFEISELASAMASGSGPLSSWDVLVRVRDGEIQRSGPLTKRARNSSASQLRTSSFADGFYALLSWKWASGLQVTLARRPFGVAGISAADGLAEIGVRRNYGSHVPRTLVLTNVGGGRIESPMTRAGENEWRATRPRFPASAVGSSSNQWLVSLETETGHRRNVHASAWELQTTAGEGDEFTARSTKSAQLVLDTRPVRCELHSFGVDFAGKLVLEGELIDGGPEVLQLSLVGQSIETVPVRISTNHGSRFRAEIDLTIDRWGYTSHGALPTGYYKVMLAGVGAPGEGLRITLSGTLFEAMPVETQSAAMRLELYLSDRGDCFVSVRPPQKAAELSRSNKQAAIDRYMTEDSAGIVPGFYYECLRGEAANDSQLELFRWVRENRPEIPQYWGVSDFSVPVPADSTPILIESAEWFEVISSVQFVCINHELPAFFTKRPGQVVVQTYHGHPFKSMGLSRWNAMRVSELEIEQNLARRQAWDLLVAPNEIAGRLYRENFPLDVEVLTVGHPRNDRLAGISHSRREGARASLGIEPDKIAVLYAPTWRDYEAASPWASQMVKLFDPVRLQRALGDEYVIMVRGHAAHYRFDNSTQDDEAVLDVTGHPDINVLIEASDIGLFDYSSIRFDYSVTGKPMVFFVPDKERYFQQLPGLLEYDSTTPGPQAETFDDLREAILDMRVPSAEWRKKLADFRSTFNPLDDGHATERLALRMLDLAGNAEPKGGDQE
ncbi:CDP-glycerol glycerophosphotransferase family protein [Salinibacterium sp. SWN1162]|nr:CDP-glycerol glycerophosphotransferase family protein [Salinibacterium sp. SWN1162]